MDVGLALIIAPATCICVVCVCVCVCVGGGVLGCQVVYPSVQNAHGFCSITKVLMVRFR